MNWYIGQEIVAVKNHSHDYFKKGQEFVIIGLRKSPCSCGHTEINIGIAAPPQGTYCTKCKQVDNEHTIFWFCESSFAPKLSLTESEEAYIEEVIKEADSIPVENLFS